MTDTIISGQKGKKGGPAQGDDTLRSETTGHVIDAISEGEIVGLVNGKASIFLNKTPLTNFEDCTFEQRVGRPDDSPILGANEVEAYQSVGITVKQPGTQPLAHIRTINDVTVDMVRVYLTLQSLYFTSKKGAAKVAHGGWKISVKPAGGAWVEKVNYPLHDKVTSPVQFQHDIMLPGVGPWDIRVEALLPDRSDDKAYETFTWDGYSAVTKSKLSYPHTALVSMELSAEHVGSSIPERIYHVRGRKILVPTNYDPVAKTYSGVWDGTFKRAYSNCPPWVLYDAATNRIFGLGNEVPNDVHNKWRLYVIGQYCDQKIKSGYKDANGADIMEPRFSFDGVITDKKQAIETINQLTAVFRGMGFYSLSQFHIAADMPQDPAHIYGPANVIDGRFEYQTSSIKARHSVVLVRFNDKNNFFAPAIEPVIDNKALKEIGWREKTLDLIGCSSRSMARRYGAWVLDTENYETETVTFNVGMDSVHALPGEVIAINDPRRAEMRVSGRIKAISGTNTIILDQVIDPAISRSGLVVYISKPDGTIFTKGNVGLGTNTINIGSGNATPDLVDCTYVIAATNLKPRQYRIVSIDEQSDGTTYQITALQYDRQKFARVEEGAEFKPEPHTLPKNLVSPPTNLTLRPKTYTEAGRVRTDIEIGWTAPQDTLVSRYEIMVSSPEQRPTLLPSTSMNSATFTSYVAGRHEVSVRTVNAAGRKSVALVGFVVIDGLAQSDVGEVRELVNAITGKPGPNFTGRDASIRWKSMMRVSDNPNDPLVERDPAVYDHNTVNVYTGTTLLRSVQVKGSSFTYSYAMNEEDCLAKAFPSAQRALRFEVSVVNQEGKVSNPTVLNLSNPAPAAISPKTAVRGNNVSVEWANPKDEDLVGVKLWIERNNTFNPLNTAPKYDGLAGFYTFTGLPVSAYYVRIAGYDAFSDDMMIISAPLLVSTGRDYFDDVAPDTPTGLVVTSSVAANGTATLVADWNDSAAADLFNYEVRIREGDGNYVSFTASQSRHEWTGLRLNTSYTVQVRAFDLSNNRSSYCAEVTHVSAADTVPPAVPSGLSLKPGFNAMVVLWNMNTEVDLAYYEVYQSTNTTAPVASTTPTYTVTSNTLNVSGLNEATAYNFWVRAVDTSGNKSAWCARVGATTASVWTWPDAAAVPTNLAVTSAFANGVSTLNVNWTASTNAVVYEIGLTEGTGNEVIINSAATNYSARVIPGVAYSVRVRALNKALQRSNWTAAVKHTATKNTVPPAAPTGLTATGSFGAITLNWAHNTEVDLSHYEIATGTATAPTTVADRTAATTSIITGLADNATRFARVRAVNTSGLTSAWSASVSAKTSAVPDPTITTEKLVGLIDSTSMKDGVELLTTWTGTALPTTRQSATISWNGRLYTWNGTKYEPIAQSSDLRFENISGTVDKGQLPAISVDKIAADLDKLIRDQGQTALADKLAAEAARDAALGHAQASGVAKNAAETAKSAAVAAKGVAEAKAQEASQSATNAGQSATAASGYANTASTKATEAEQSATSAAAQVVVARTNASRVFPAPIGDGSMWTHSLSGLPETVASFPTGAVATVAGGVAFIPQTIGSNNHIVSRAVLPWIEGRKYRITVQVKSSGLTTGRLRPLVSGLRSDFIGSGQNLTAGNLMPTVAGEWQTVSNVVTLPAPTANTTQFRIGVYVQASITPAVDIEVRSILIEDVTSEIAAMASASAASESAQTASTKATEAGTEATAAATARTAAETARGQAQTAASNAAQSETNAAGSASSAQSSATTAANSATTASQKASAAAGSATTASTKATEAAQSATSAQTQATKAETEAGKASTSASQAATSATNAAGSASSASTSAGAAAGSATTAGQKADAASNSAQTASTKATEASQSASAASTARTGAETARGQAQTAASNAATSETNAAGSASAAASSATVSATALTDTQKALASSTALLTAIPSPALKAFGTGVTGLPDGYFTANLDNAYGSDADGAYVQRNPTGNNAYVMLRGVVPSVLGNVYRVTARVKASHAMNLRIQTSWLNTTGSATTNSAYASTNFAAGEIKTISMVIGRTVGGLVDTAAGTDATWNDAAFIRFGITCPTLVAGSDYKVYSITVEDLTQADQAARQAALAGGSATAAATSASNAKASETAAGQSASSASGSATTASTKAGQASTSAGQASTSATNAAGSASQAAQSATTAAQSATTAGQKADAASQSASTASTKATEASQSASAANTARTAAETAKGLAEAAEGRAATSATNAAGSASSASSYSTLAAGSLTSVQKALANTSAVVSIIPTPALAAFGMSHGGHPDSYSTIADSAYGSDADGAYVQRVATANSNALLLRSLVPSVLGNVYRVTARVKASHAMQLRLNCGWVGADGTVVTSSNYAGQNFAAGEIKTLTMVFGRSSGGLVTHAGGSDANWNSAAGLRFGISVGTGVANSNFQLYEIRVDDLTGADAAAREASAAAGSASAASTSASNAKTSETNAGQSASSATTAKDQAESARGLAVAAEGRAATSATNAATSATEASSFAQLAALALSGGMAKNPTFMNWTGSVPPNVSVIQGSNGTFAKAEGKYGSAIELNVTDTANVGPYFQIASNSNQLNGNSNPAQVLVTVEIEPISGSLNGYLLDAAWRVGSTWYYVAKRLTNSLSLGSIQTVQVALDRPAAAANADAFMVRVFPSHNSAGAVRSITKAKVHRFDVQEILADSIIDEQRRTKATVDGLSESAYVMRVKAGGASAGFEMVAAGNPSGPASTIRMSASEILLDGSVKTPHLDAGVVTASKLAVGFGGNLLVNSDWGVVEDSAATPKIIKHWQTYRNGQTATETNVIRREAGVNSDWTGASFPVMQIGQSTDTPTGYMDVMCRPPVDNTGAGAPGYPVKPGAWLDASVQLSVHRCRAELRIQWRDAAGVTISYTTAGVLVNDMGDDARNPDTWTRISTKGQAPAGAAFATFHLRKLGTTSGTNSYVFAHKPMMALTTEQASETTPYAPSSFTFIDGDQIITNSIKARSIDVTSLVADLATINTAYIKEANITGTLSAAKLTAGTALANTITVNGTALGTTSDRAADPAARLNAGSTTIDPGKIKISGSKTLADWRMGGDETRINGGEISANTIKANSLEIGSRNITLTGIQFEHNKPATNQVSWSAGAIRYVNDSGVITSKSIPAGSATWTSGVVYIYWVKDSSTFSSTTSLDTAMATNNVCIATYEGDFRLDADFGRTVIDGDMIKTGTIRATNLVQTEALITNSAQIKGATIEDAHITGTITATKIRAGTALASTITVNGTALSDTTSRAADPAARVNAGSTKIDPGKITISGGTTLSNWIKGGDVTKIDGGMISANTIKANALEIGSRNITLTGIQFEHNRPSVNSVNWTAGSIRYTDDSGVETSRSIAANNKPWTSGVLYIYWVKGNTYFSDTTDQRQAQGPDRLIIATYEGDTKLDADYGRTVVDGSNIKTGTITASQLIKTAALITDHIQIGENKLYVPRFWTRADVTLGTTHTSSSPYVLFNYNIPDFDGGGYLISFNGTVNTRVDYDQYARIQILVDDVVRTTQSIGLRTSGANTGGELSANLIASFAGSGATNVKVRAWPHSHTETNGGSSSVKITNMSLTVSGSRR